MTIDYIKFSPTGNITVLVRSPVPRARQASLAARLLRADCVGGEQAGYLEPPTDPRAAARLQMMGGEFCGNATMSLAALLAREAGSQRADYLLEVSGSDGLVPCRIERTGDGWLGAVRMPLPDRIRTFDPPDGLLPAGVPLVEFPGIAHLILSADAGLDEAALREALPRWLKTIGADALGALAWDDAASTLDPLVYVPSAGTLVREHGCGSGSAAIGCWLARQAGHSVRVAVSQPGGVIRVQADTDGRAITCVTITGKVALVEEGKAEVRDEGGKAGY